MINSVKRTIELLKGYEEIPRNGLLIYSAFGYEQDLKQNYEYCIHFEPFLSLKQRLYTIEYEYSTGFNIEPILEMIQLQKMIKTNLMRTTEFRVRAMEEMPWKPIR